jgi:hypothetical protein
MHFFLFGNSSFNLFFWILLNGYSSPSTCLLLQSMLIMFFSESNHNSTKLDGSNLSKSYWKSMPNLGDEDHSEDEEDDHNNVNDHHTSNGNLCLKSPLFYKKDCFVPI